MRRVDLSGRRALITGASRGIGRAIAESLANAGADVALLARGSTEAVVRSCSKHGRNAFSLTADMTRVDQLEAAVARAAESLGGLDVLVNAAGSSWVGPVHRVSDQTWRSMVDVNLTGAMESVRLALPHLRSSSHGHILFIGSVASRAVYAGGAGYCATKHGLLGFAGSLYEELRALRIKVTTICPGVVDTEMTKGEWAGFDRSAMLRPTDVADAAMYVMSCGPRACPTEIILRCHHPIMV